MRTRNRRMRSAGRRLSTPGVAPAGGVAPDLLTGLLAYYRLDGDATDSSGNGRNLTDFGMSFGVGKIGQGRDSGGGQTFGFHFSNATGPGSIAGWFKGINPFAGKGSHFGAAAAEFVLRYDSDAVSGGRIEALINGAIIHTGLYDIGAGVWVHYALVVGADGWELYQNGASIGSGTEKPSNLSSSLINIDRLEAPDSSNPMDELAFYDIALSAAQVAALYNGGAGFDPTA